MRQYKEIAFNGKKHPISFNRFALGKFMRHEGITIQQFANLPQDLETMQQLVYHGLIGGYAAKFEKEPPVSYMQFCIDMADDNDALEEAMAYFAEQNAMEGESPKKPKARKAEPKK